MNTIPLDTDTYLNNYLVPTLKESLKGYSVYVLSKTEIKFLLCHCIRGSNIEFKIKIGWYQDEVTLTIPNRIYGGKRGIGITIQKSPAEMDFYAQRLHSIVLRGIEELNERVLIEPE
jgi:hypothetical protein